MPLLTRIEEQRSWAQLPIDGSEVLYIPFWHPSYGSNPANYISKDRNAISFARTGGGWGKDGWAADGDDFLKYAVSQWRASDDVGSVSFWVKSSNTGTQAVFSSADEAGALHMMQIGIRATTGEPFINVNGTTANDGIEGNTAITDGVFHFVTISTNGSAWRIDLDGADDGANVIVGGNTGTWFNDMNARDNIVIGALIRNANSAFMNGTIGEVWVHSRQLSLAEHQNIRSMTAWRYG